MGLPGAAETVLGFQYAKTAFWQVIFEVVGSIDTGDACPYDHYVKMTGGCGARLRWVGFNSGMHRALPYGLH
jgi:hypothetical protein